MNPALRKELPADITGRFAGCLLGLAVGDAVGTTNEFQPGPVDPPVTDMVGGGPFRLRPGEWTDDTSMALCLADSLIECGGFNARDQMERYCRWWREGYNSVNGRCFDIGNTVATALRRFERTGDPLAGSTEPWSAGNGSLMRLAPVVLFYHRDLETAIRYAAESSRTTHAAAEAVDACRYFASLLIPALAGDSKQRVLASRTLPEYAPAIQEIASGSFQVKPAAEISASGYVVHSLEAALWCFAGTNSFRDGCLRAANLGQDSDTVAAIYGQIAGAYYGESGIPDDWRRRLAWHDRIRSKAIRLLECGATRSRRHPSL